MEIPKATQAHKRLRAMAGDFVTQEVIHPFPGMPEGGKATSSTHSRMALNDFALLQDYEQKVKGRIMCRGHGLLRYDAKRRRYEMHWFDSMGGPDNVLHGDFDDKVLTLSGKDGQGQKIRLLYEIQRGGGYHFEMQMAQKGKRWDTVMEGDALPQGRRRKASQAKPGRALKSPASGRTATARAAAKAEAERRSEFRRESEAAAERRSGARSQVRGRGRARRPHSNTI